MTPVFELPRASLLLCAILVSAWLSGYGIALFSIILATLLFTYVYLEPAYSFSMQYKNIPRLLSFILTAMFIGFIGSSQRKSVEQLRRASNKLEEANQELSKTNAELLAENSARELAQEELKRNETLLNEGEKISHTGSWKWDVSKQKITWSKENYAIFGYSTDSEPSVEMILSRVHEEDKSNLRILLEKAIKNNQRFESEYRIVLDQQTRFLKSVGVPVFSDNGALKIYMGITADITERKQAELRLKEREQQYKLLVEKLALALEAGNSTVWEMNIETGRVIQNDSPVYSDLAYDLRELKHVNDWLPLIHEEDRHIVVDALDSVVEKGKDTYRIEIRLKKKEGGWQWVLIHAIVAERDRQGKALRLVGTHTDITERKTVEEKVRAAALHDTLTGLPNRAFIFEFGAHLLAAAERTHQHCALLFIDLDRFKPINDIYGHHMGDQVLQEVAKRLLALSRAEDLVGRLGGDEFVILLPHLDGGRHRAVTVAQHVLESIAQPITAGTLSFSLSPSIGISYYPEDSKEISGLIYTADLAMYLAKQNGRGNYQFYSPELEARAEEVYALEACLKKALTDGGFALFYQPVVDIQTGKLISAEALVRLSDAEGEAISPQRFIPIAEAAGMIGDIGEWVAQEACRQHQAWLKENLNVTIAINVSPLQFRQAGFADKIHDLIKSTGLPPGALQIEVTEGAVMESVDEAVEILTKIKQLGVKVALDDFGTGYSSLSRLSTLPLDKIKVDQSFVRQIGTDPASRAVTETIISLGKSLNLEVIGEGVESEQALSYLRAQGCDQGQGYWFSRPLPAHDFATWCQQQQHAEQLNTRTLH